jgi:hypothetical protein
VALGDARIQGLHQAGKLDQPGGGVGSLNLPTIVPFLSLAPLWDGLLQGSRLRALVHKSYGT